MIVKCVFAAALTAALVLAGCLCRALVLLPLRAKGAVVLLRGAGDGSALEQDLRACLLLRRWGVLRQELILADCGLSPEGRKLAEQLTKLDGGILLCAPEELAERLTREA